MQLAANWAIAGAVHTLGTVCKFLRKGTLDGSRGEGKWFNCNYGGTSALRLEEWLHIAREDELEEEGMKGKPQIKKGVGGK